MAERLYGKRSLPCWKSIRPTKPHSWRDILIHLATMIVGLSIALARKHGGGRASRHLVAEARENIHREIAGNLQLLPRDLTALQHDAERMKQNNSILRQFRDHPHTPHDALHFELFWSSFGESAWQTARETGALNYMSYNEVQAALAALRTAA